MQGNKGSEFARGLAGSCAAGGYYNYNSSGGIQAFVVTEAGGRWGKAVEVPGTAAPGKLRLSDVNSVSCGAAGSCTAGGFYDGEPIVVSKS
jgi:hypothetical protein